MPARKSTRNKGRANFYRHGTNNVIDDRTGFKRKADDCAYEWNGLFVGRDQWEERHPMDFLRGFPDNQQPEVSRPEATDSFLQPGDVTPDDLSP